MSEIKVNSIKGVGASAAAITVNNTDGTCTANITNRTNKNLVVNGACLIAQRGTSSTTVGYQTVDRYYLDFTGTDEAPTQAQVDVASGTTPYTNGFRKAYKITNGNQTSGAGSSDGIFLNYSIEAQDVANSGWNYTSTSSYITLSFWVKSSVAQNFYGRLYSYDGTNQGYAFETGSLTADTWTKITKTISGNSNLTFDNNNGAGLLLELIAFRGTGFTASMTLNQWAAYNSNSRVPDMTSTWYTTNDATLEVTGLQLEVSDHATSFEHLPYGVELARCQRYFYMHVAGANVNDNDEDKAICTAVRWTNSSFYGTIFFPVYMRAKPTIHSSLGTDRIIFYKVGSTDGVDSIGIQMMGYANAIINFYGGVSSSAPNGWMQLNNNDAFIGFNAEL